MNARLLKTDAAGFVEFAEGLFESLLADAESFPDRRRRTAIVEGHIPAVAFKRLDDLVCERGHTLVTRRIEAQVNLPAGTDGADKALQLLADSERRGEVFVVEQAAMRVLHDGVVT